MSSLKLERGHKIENDQKHSHEIQENGEQRLEEFEALKKHWTSLDVIDDDDKAAMENTQKEADAIADTIQLIESPIIEIDPPSGHTMDDFSSGLTFDGKFLEPSLDEDSLFQEIADECEQINSELEDEFTRIAKELENIF